MKTWLQDMLVWITIANTAYKQSLLRACNQSNQTPGQPVIHFPKLAHTFLFLYSQNHTESQNKLESCTISLTQILTGNNCAYCKPELHFFFNKTWKIWFRTDLMYDLRKHDLGGNLKICVCSVNSVWLTTAWGR